MKRLANIINTFTVVNASIFFAVNMLLLSKTKEPYYGIMAIAFILLSIIALNDIKE